MKTFKSSVSLSGGHEERVVKLSSCCKYLTKVSHRDHADQSREYYCASSTSRPYSSHAEEMAFCNK